MMQARFEIGTKRHEGVVIEEEFDQKFEDT